MNKMTMYSLSLMATLAATSAFAAEPSAATPASPVKSEPQKGGKMFEENDANKDGFISKDEWRARGDKMFGETDANSDSKLTQEEVKAHYDKKRAQWKERRAERKEHMGEVKEKMREQANTKPTTKSPAASE